MSRLGIRPAVRQPSDAETAARAQTLKAENKGLLAKEKDEMNGKMTIIVCVGLMTLATTAAMAATTTYSDEAVFRAAAGSTITYGFETHGVAESAELASPLSAGDLDGNFALAYTNLNSFQIIDNGAAQGVADGTHYLFTHSAGSAGDYTLTFSNFGGSSADITAFGLTVTDFASNITQTATITYDAGGLTGTLLVVPGGQPSFTQNFVGLTVDGVNAFDTITLTFDDNLSGFQDFDEVTYTPEPATLSLLALGGLVALRRRRR